LFARFLFKSTSVGPRLPSSLVVPSQNSPNDYSRSNRKSESSLLTSILADHVRSLGLFDSAQVVGYEKIQAKDGSENLVEVELAGDVLVAQSQSLFLSFFLGGG
jgi:hypothetical protein